MRLSLKRKAAVLLEVLPRETVTGIPAPFAA